MNSFDLLHASVSNFTGSIFYLKERILSCDPEAVLRVGKIYSNSLFLNPKDIRLDKTRVRTVWLENWARYFPLFPGVHHISNVTWIVPFKFILEFPLVNLWLLNIYLWSGLGLSCVHRFYLLVLFWHFLICPIVVIFLRALIWIPIFILIWLDVVVIVSIIISILYGSILKILVHHIFVIGIEKIIFISLIHLKFPAVIWALLFLTVYIRLVFSDPCTTFLISSFFGLFAWALIFVDTSFSTLVTCSIIIHMACIITNIVPSVIPRIAQEIIFPSQHAFRAPNLRILRLRALLICVSHLCVLLIISSRHRVVRVLSIASSNVFGTHHALI